jgi:predicted esterase/catechol 2,3-dioxygenase-like lactoylglutathione lyase family enzyme
MSGAAEFPGGLSGPKILGIHHVTAICGDPQRNLDFYSGLLGLRFVKRTVNFDDPQTYHFYYGDESGRPGSILTFFPWPGARRGRVGPGQVAVTSFATVPQAIGFWVERLIHHGIKFQGPSRRIAEGSAPEQVLAFQDHDGLLLEIVGSTAAESRAGWAGAPGIGSEHAIRGFHGVTIWVENGDPTVEVLVKVLGSPQLGLIDSVRRFGAGDGGPGTIIDVRPVGGFPSGVGGVGTVHHVAWRVADDAAQLEMRARVAAEGLRPTPVIDRTYFHSVYFREPGGVLFELATDAPGFAIDEPLERLGERLMLPPQYEGHRAQIEAALPPIHLPLPAREAIEVSAGGGPEDVGAEALGFVHKYLPPASGAELAGSTTLLLLHGTGGDEDDLVPLGRRLLPGAGLLSPRGKVLERGMPRFFRRLAEGVFDQEDLARRTDELAEFVETAVRTYGLCRDGIVAVGFSNGANIAASLLLRRPGILRGAVLLSPMVPFELPTTPELAGTAVFIGAGRGDSIAPPAQAERLAAILGRAGAAVTMHWEPGGHAVAQAEVEAAHLWLLASIAERPLPDHAAQPRRQPSE